MEYVLRSKIIILFLFTVTLVAFQNFNIPELNSQISSSNESIDFIIMNVCVDGNDKPVSGDPATCPNQRNIRIGESVPFLLTDFGPNNARYQSVASYPVHGRDGQLKVLVSKHMRANFSSQQYSFNFDPLYDGFDLISTNGQYFSGERTSDGGCFDQMISENGWIFFDRNHHEGSTLRPITITRLTPRPGCDATSSGEAYTVWNRRSFTFTSGKTFDSIQSYHFANQNLSQLNNALEKYYFTKQYGFTRWEAWIPYERCVNERGANHPICNQTFLIGRCNGGNSANIGERLWIRADCRDTTNYIPVDQPYFPVTEHMAASSIDYPSTKNANILTNYVRSHYLSLLGREADSNGFKAYFDSLVTGQLTSLQFHQQLTQSPEATSRIRDLYRQVFDREPDEAGVSGWQYYMTSNVLYLASVRIQLARSEEARDRARALYQNTLNREATDAEIVRVQNILASSNTSFAQIRSELAHGTAAGNLIRKYYIEILEREANDATIQFHQTQLARNLKTSSQIRYDLANGAEANRKIYTLAIRHLGRTKETVSLESARSEWQNILIMSGKLSQVRETFARSEEAKQLLTDVAQKHLGRTLTATEMETWVTRNAKNFVPLIFIRQILMNNQEALTFRGVKDRKWVYKISGEGAKDMLYSSTNPVEGLNEGYRYSGLAFQVYKTAADDRKPIYRCKIAATGKHFLSDKIGCSGQTNESILGYLPKTTDNIMKRTLHTCVGNYFLYTMNEQQCLNLQFEMRPPLGSST